VKLGKSSSAARVAAITVPERAAAKPETEHESGSINAVWRRRWRRSVIRRRRRRWIILRGCGRDADELRDCRDAEHEAQLCSGFHSVLL
jgi:hypothetical protein